jgi:tRNA (guanine-N7-)-methyltransferase
VGKNKLARWIELGSYANVIQPETGDISAKDHPLKGNWNKEFFKHENPVILELGCGKGEYTIGLAARFPSSNYIGIDIKGARMWRGAKSGNEMKLDNVAFLRTRIEFISSFFLTDEVDEIWITFPDPHPGGSNSNKRLTSPWFLNKYRMFLKNKGLVHLKTDNTELFNYTKTVIENNDLEMTFATNDLYSGSFIIETRPSGDNLLAENPVRQNSVSEEILSIKTHYEKIFLGEGSKINYLSFMLEKGKTIKDTCYRTQKE